MAVVIVAIPWLFMSLLVGAAACVPLYGGNLRRFLRSSLFVKVVMWIPLFVVFVAAVAGGFTTGLLLGVGLASVGAVEWFRRDRARRTWWYLALFAASCAAWPISTANLAPALWMTYCLSSVFSDVMAFFFGRYLGRHRLPDWINRGKSWEGVFGQLIGGVLGVLHLGMIFGTEPPLLAGLVIGAASAAGDLVNSVAKRIVGVEDWGSTIPGHGGVIDRFCSLNVALTAAVLLPR
ncbi:phosphatidate cytidylyltransferase [Leifsonia shinshuensis]|uniref:Phosphatidate cytidylyltransferase n=1 Tax=Leifsonia shinshuensis TaxID=150026 RepID=A0A853D0W2_9MICO|nr:phosphatidate cytidylyltransferase [Leifsonia shinshuensis]NYJ24395.1 CDP-diglyceride synthetase [Leifsonia shinshuensis]